MKGCRSRLRACARKRPGSIPGAWFISPCRARISWAEVGRARCSMDCRRGSVRVRARRWSSAARLGGGKSALLRYAARTAETGPEHCARTRRRPGSVAVLRRVGRAQPVRVVAQDLLDQLGSGARRPRPGLRLPDTPVRSILMPDSSATSRVTADDTVSPTSTWPPGSSQLPSSLRRTSRTRSRWVTHDREADDDHVLDRWRVRIAEVLIQPHERRSWPSGAEVFNPISMNFSTGHGLATGIPAHPPSAL